MTTTASTVTTSLPRKVVTTVPSSKHPVSALAAYKARLNKPTADTTPTAAAATVASINTTKRVAHTTTVIYAFLFFVSQVLIIFG
jgi:hypothetical protein